MGLMGVHICCTSVLFCNALQPADGCVSLITVIKPLKEGTMQKQILIKGLPIALLSLAFNAQARETPRVYVDGIAAAIEENYFDEARAKKIAADLRSAASTGKFDALQNERELSSELSTWLDPLDTHFDVSWAEPKPASTAARDSTLPERVIPSNNPDKRKNYGIRGVEVLPGNIGYLDLRQFAGVRVWRTRPTGSSGSGRRAAVTCRHKRDDYRSS